MAQSAPSTPTAPLTVPATIAALRKKHAVSDGGGKSSSVKSTVGIVFEGTAIAMVVPGGPAFKPSKEGKRIEKGDVLVKIDDKTVTANNVIAQLRGADIVGSTVKIEVHKQEGGQHQIFSVTRADIRSVEKTKDLYMKLAELQAESRAPRQEKVEAISKELEDKVGVVTDWASAVESALRLHIDDLESALRKAETELKQQQQDAATAAAEAAAAASAELTQARASAAVDLKAQRDTAAHELSALHERLNREHAAALARAEERADADRVALEAQVQAAKAEAEHLTNQSRSYDAKLLACQSDIRRLQHELDLAMTKVADTTAQAAALEQRLAEASAEVSMLLQARAKLEQDIRARTREFDALKQTTDEQSSVADKLRTQVEEGKASMDEAERRAHQLQTDLNAAQVKLQQQTQQAGSDLEGAARRVAAAEEERDELQRQHAHSEEQRLKEALRLRGEQDAHEITKRNLSEAQASLDRANGEVEERGHHVTRLQEEVLGLTADIRQLQQIGEDKQRDASQQQRRLQEANRRLASHQTEMDGVEARLKDAQEEREALNKRLRDMQADSDARRLLYERTAQLCGDNKYRDLIVELQREARNADARRDAAVTKMEQTAQELLRLKASSARAAALAQERHDARVQALQVELKAAQTQAISDRKALEGGCTSEGRKELERKLLEAVADRDAQEARASGIGAQLAEHAERADTALNLAKVQLLKAKHDAELNAAALAKAQAAAEGADKAHAAQLAALHDARKLEVDRYEERCHALQAEKARAEQLKTLNSSALVRPEELEAECASLKAHVQVLQRELEDARRMHDVARMQLEELNVSFRHRHSEKQREVDMLEQQLQESARKREREAQAAGQMLEAKEAELRSIRATLRSGQLRDLSEGQRESLRNGCLNASSLSLTDTDSPPPASRFTPFSPSSFLNIHWSQRAPPPLDPRASATLDPSPLKPAFDAIYGCNGAMDTADHGKQHTSSKTSAPPVSPGGNAIERCEHCGIKGEAARIRATGPHHGRMCPYFVWMVASANNQRQPQLVLLH